MIVGKRRETNRRSGFCRSAIADVGETAPEERRFSNNRALTCIYFPHLILKSKCNY